MKDSDDNRRSCRSRKVVDYTKLDSLGDDDHDDFKDSSPPNKRQKQRNVEKKDTKKKAKDNALKKECIQPTVQRKERVSLPDKVLDRDTQTALQLSVSDSNCGYSESLPNKENLNENIEEKRTLKNVQVISEFQEKIIEVNGARERNLENDLIEEGLRDLLFQDNNLNFKEKSDAVSKTLQQKASQIPKVQKNQTTKPREYVELPLKRPLATSGCINIPTTKLKLPNTGLRLGLSRRAPSKPLHSFVRIQQ